MARAWRHADIVEGSVPIALAFPWTRRSVPRALAAVAVGICAALPTTMANALPLVLLIDGDIAMSLGRLDPPGNRAGRLRDRDRRRRAQGLDYVDIGRQIAVSNTMPVVIKSLLFE